MGKLAELLKAKFLCCHDWKLIHEVSVTQWGGDRYRVYHYVCTKCGKFKKRKSNQTKK